MLLFLPAGLEVVDIVRLRFTLDFVTPCTLQPADFLGLGRLLKMSGRHLSNNDSLAQSQWEALFNPPLSADPVALRNHQKPAPAFVMNIPISEPQFFDVGDQLDFETLFIGSGIPLVHIYLLSLIHLGRLGLVAGEGQFDVREVFSTGGQGDSRVWRHGTPVDSLPCQVSPLDWLLESSRLKQTVKLSFLTPVRLLVKGKPLRNPSFGQIFPFMLRRVTSMLHAHAGLEIDADSHALIESARLVPEMESRLEWHDWRSVGQQGSVIGGFVGELELKTEGIDELYWIIALASHLGIGKGAAYGAGHFELVG